MTYNAGELLEAGVRGVRLVSIACGTKTWRYCNASEPINIAGSVYLPLEGLRTSEPPSASSVSRTSLEVFVPQDIELVTILKLGAPTVEITAEILDGQLDQAEFVQVFSGRLTNYKIKRPYASLLIESLRSSSKRFAATQVVSSRCPVPLYEVGTCNVDKELFKISGAVTAVSGLTITVAEAATRADPWFRGGFVQWLDPVLGVAVVRDIEKSLGAVLTLSTAPVRLPLGTVVDMYPGCDHRWDGDCTNKFNNALNCRALPFLRNGEPFSGETIF